MYDDYGNDQNGGSFDSDFTNNSRKKRVKKKVRKKKRGPSFEESSPALHPQSPPTSPESQKRRRRKKKTPVSPIGDEFDAILLPSMQFQQQPKKIEQPKQQQKQPTHTPQTFQSWPKTARTTETTAETSQTNGPPGLSPPPGFGFMKRKRRKRRKREEREQRGATRSLFQQVTALFNRPAYVSEFKGPANRESNQPQLQVQVIDTEDSERISLGSVEEALAKARNFRQQTAARRLFSAAIQRVDPRQFVSIRNNTVVNDSLRFNQQFGEEYQSKEVKEEKLRCCPPCFYYLFFLTLIAAGLTVTILAIQGEFDA